MRLIQFQRSDNNRAVGLIEDDLVYDITSVNQNWDSLYNIFWEARRKRITIEELISGSDFRSRSDTYNYSKLLMRFPKDPDGWIIPPIDHPDPAHCIITGTGLTHLGSMAQRNNMHKTNDKGAKTDSQKMFEMGFEGGKPKLGDRGVQPEWFYRGNGFILRGHNDFLDIPEFTEDGGEEPEIVGCYIIGDDGIPYRLGFAVANEWSDHTMERVNYLWLAPSKLRTCSIGPELITDIAFKDIRSNCCIYRDDNLIYDSGELLTGEDNMTHTLANLEDHHFKYPQFRIPGDVHIHFFGTMKLSYGNRDKFRDGDKIVIKFDNMGGSLINYVRKLPSNTNPIQILKG